MDRRKIPSDDREAGLYMARTDSSLPLGAREIRTDPSLTYRFIDVVIS